MAKRPGTDPTSNPDKKKIRFLHSSCLSFCKNPSNNTHPHIPPPHMQTKPHRTLATVVVFSAPWKRTGKQVTDGESGRDRTQTATVVFSAPWKRIGKQVTDGESGRDRAQTATVVRPGNAPMPFSPHTLNRPKDNNTPTLRYTESIWDGCPLVPCIDRLLYAETLAIPFTRSRPWENLGNYQQTNFGSASGFGWNEDSWDDGGPIPAQMLRTWNEIPPNIRDLALKYRYEHDTWAGCTMTTCLDKYK